MTADKITLHGTAVVIRSASHDPSAVFIRGASGKGKSDLAFRLIEAGGELLSDDQVLFEKRQEKIYANFVESIKGLIEVRGIGLLHYPVAHTAQVRLVIDLVSPEEVPRMPEWEQTQILGIDIPRLKLNPFEASAPLKVKKAMEIAHRPQMMV